MKIAVCSDIHVEFGPITLKNTEDAEVLILSGDIIVAKDLMDANDPSNSQYDKSHRYHDFFQNCAKEFAHVVYIMGNHEHYNGDFATTYTILKKRLKYIPNLYVLDKETKKIGDITFIAGTLWTDMNKEDSITMYDVGRNMNDFRLVGNGNRKRTSKVPLYKKDETGNMVVEGYKFKDFPTKFSTSDAVEDHKKMLYYIRSCLHTSEIEKSVDKYVVVGHHAPCKKSTKPQYEHDVIMNGGYSSDLSEFILDRPQIKLWTHGHTHHEFDYMLGDTRIVCNPRGYIGYEHQAEVFKLKYVEV